MKQIYSSPWLKIKKDLLKEGLFKGTLALTVEVLGLVNSDETETQKVLGLIVAETLPKALKVIRFFGKFREEDLQFQTLVATLRKSLGYSIHVIWNGETQFSFFKDSNWMIISTSNEKIFSTSQELWWNVLDPEKTFVEPFLPGLEASAACYLTSLGRLTFEALETFILESKRVWRLL